MDRIELATTLQFAFNQYPDPEDFGEFLGRVLPEQVDDLTVEQRLHLGEIKKWIAENNPAKARVFAMQMLKDIPRSPSTERTNLRLNWVVAVCTVLGLVITAVSLSRGLNAAPWKTILVPQQNGTNTPQSPLALTTQSSKIPDIPPVMRYLHSMQFGVILILAFLQGQWLRSAGRRIKPSMPIAFGTLAQFRKGWSALWWSWAVLYAWFTFAAVAVGKETALVLAIGDVVNSTTGIALWWCFLALDLPSVNLPGQEQRDRSFRKAVWAAAAIGLGCAVAGCADRYLSIGHLGVTMVGAFNALGLACLAGRFTSHWMTVPRWQILLIYIYSMLQLIYPFFDLLGDRWEIGVYMMVLMLKIMLANTLRSLVDAGGLDNYLEAAQAGKLGFLPSAVAA